MIRASVQTLFLMLALALGACGDPVVVGGGGGAPTPTPTPNAPTPTPNTPTPEPVDIETETAEASGPTYADDDFVEVDIENRDPFRSFASTFRQVASAQQAETVHSIMPTSAIDEMRLIAIISGVVRPRAMLLDGQGVGHTVERGDYIGRPEVIQVGESMPVPLHWRVARIRSGEVVLTREDPTAPDRPPLTRVIPLYEEGEDPIELRRRAIERAREREEAQAGINVPGADRNAAPVQQTL